MFGSIFTGGNASPFDDHVLDQLADDAGIVVANPERYPNITVEMARRTLAMVARLRHRNPPDSQRLSA